MRRISVDNISRATERRGIQKISIATEKQGEAKTSIAKRSMAMQGHRLVRSAEAKHRGDTRRKNNRTRKETRMTKQNKMQLTIALTILVLLLAAVAATLKDYRNQRIPEPETTAKISKIADFETTKPETTSTVSQTTETTTEATQSTQATEEAYIPPETQKTAQESSSRGTAAFYHDDGEMVYISAEEYYTIAGIVMNEAGYGTYEGCVAVAQAIRNQIIREKHLGHKYDIESVRQTYQMWYTKKPNDQSRKAVTDVFYNHIVVTEEPIIAWCATGHASGWHAQQVAVCSFGGNTFYKLTKKDW